MSDTYKVIYSPEALDDIRKIYSYIAFKLLVPDTALNQVNRLRPVLERLLRYR
jgi:plasmid stabilization system protein ParE